MITRKTKQYIRQAQALENQGDNAEINLLFVEGIRYPLVTVGEGGVQAKVNGAVTYPHFTDQYGEDFTVRRDLIRGWRGTEKLIAAMDAEDAEREAAEAEAQAAAEAKQAEWVEQANGLAAEPVAPVIGFDDEDPTEIA